MEYKSLICPNTKTCKIYKKWAKQNHTTSAIVLLGNGDIWNPSYTCIAREFGKSPFPKDIPCLNEKLANILFTFETNQKLLKKITENYNKK